MLRSFSCNQLKKFSSCLAINSKPFSVSQSNNNLYDDWKKLAEKPLKGKSPESLIWKTPEVVFISIFVFPLG